MSGKGEYFLVRNIQSLLGAEVLCFVASVFGESVPRSPPPLLFPGKVGCNRCWGGGLRMSGRDALAGVAGWLF